VGPSEITSKNSAYVYRELLGQWTIETVTRPQLSAHFFRYVWILQRIAERIARGEMDQNEGDRRDECDDYYYLCETPK
jgi:hypothetical protein